MVAHVGGTAGRAAAESCPLLKPASQERTARLAAAALNLGSHGGRLWKSGCGAPLSPGTDSSLQAFGSQPPRGEK